MFKLLQMTMSIIPLPQFGDKNEAIIRQSVYLSRQTAPLALKDPGEIRSMVTIFKGDRNKSKHTSHDAF